jgi:hypothetical protein
MKFPGLMEESKLPEGVIPGLRITQDGNKGPSLTVENFLKMRSLAHQTGDGSSDVDAALSVARVYHIDQLSYATYYRHIDVWVENTIFGTEWQPATLGPAPDDGVDHVEGVLKLSKAGEAAALDHLPFPDTYFGFGSGIGLSDTHVDMRGLELEWDIVEAKLLAIHVADGKQVWEHIQAVCGDGLTRLVSYPCRREDDDGEVIWRGNSALVLTPWVIQCLIGAVEKHAAKSSRIVPDRAAKRHLKRTGQRMRPPRFYTVRTTTLVDRTIADEVMSEATQRSSPSYRFDVRGHWRLLTKRGTEALLAKDRFALEARGYVIGTSDAELGPHTTKALLDRGIPLPAEGEWVAARLVRVKDHQKGEGEYIQAVRTA